MFVFGVDSGSLGLNPTVEKDKTLAIVGVNAHRAVLVPQKPACHSQMSWLLGQPVSSHSLMKNAYC